MRHLFLSVFLCALFVLVPALAFAQDTSSTPRQASALETAERSSDEALPRDSGPTLADVQAAFEADNYSRTIELADQILATDTLNVDADATGAHAFRGRAYAEMGRLDSALTAINRSLNTDPFFAEGYVYRARVLQQQDRLSDALADMTEAVDMAPNNIRYRREKAALELELNDYDTAIETYSTILTRRPDQQIALVGRARAYMGMKNYEQAYYDAEDAIQAGVGGAVPYRIKAEALYATNQFSLAVEAYSALIEVLESTGASAQERALAYSNRSQARIGTSNFEAAVQDATRAIELAPDLAYPYRNRAVAYGNLEQRDLSCNDLDAALARGFTQKHGPEVQDIRKNYCQDS